MVKVRLQARVNPSFTVSSLLQIEPAISPENSCQEKTALDPQNIGPMSHPVWLRLTHKFRSVALLSYLDCQL